MIYKNIKIEWLGHSSILIKGNKKIIYIDPYDLQGEKEKADYILITHSHYDHCSIADIKKLIKKETIIIIPQDCQSKINKMPIDIHTKIIEPKYSINIEGLKILAIPAYNLNKPYHPKEEYWNGYVIEISGTRIYHSGDTDLIPEIKSLSGKIDIVLLSIGGTYTMNYNEAAEAASIIKPKLAIPIHYGGVVGNENNALDFIRLCKEKNIEARIL